MFKIALFEPEIPQNTGNIARLCAGTDTELILIGKIGFSLSDKYLKRAGLDYWEHVSINLVESFEDFEKIYPPEKFFYALITKFAEKTYKEIPNQKTILIFGNESSGLPENIRKKYFDKTYKIPMNKKIRSHNLSNSAAIVLYDLISRNNFMGLS